MKDKILDLIKSAVLLILIFLIGVIGFRVSFILGTPHEKEEFNIPKIRNYHPIHD